MSCGRSDHTHLVGCKINDVGVGSCSRGCCWYPDSEIPIRTHPHLLKSSQPEHNLPEPPRVSPRTGLYYAQCQASFRPTFICSKPTCRRSFKPLYDPERNEYRIDEYQNWMVRPLASETSGLAAAIRGNQYMAGSISAEEFAILKAETPEFWWTQLVDNGHSDIVVPASHNIRCPSCGGASARVRPAFEVPAKRDDKGWRKIGHTIESGEDMAARFSNCATVEEHREMVEEAVRLQAREKGTEAWNEETRRRIAALGLSEGGSKVEYPSPSGSTRRVVIGYGLQQV